MSKQLYAGLAKQIQRVVQANQCQVAEGPLRRAIDEHLVAAYLLARDGHLNNMNGGAGPAPNAFLAIAPLEALG